MIISQKKHFKNTVPTNDKTKKKERKSSRK